MIHYYSTNKQAPRVTFKEALFRGLAPDGGLYFPETFPRFSAEELEGLRGKPLQHVAHQVLQKWFGDEIDDEALEMIATEAQNFAMPMHRIGDIHVLELFHGPTLAFKDVAAQNLPRLMSYFLQKEQREVTLLVATSGDTGGAIAHGFSDVPNINVVVLFPKGRVSALQEEQLTRVADNVTAVEVDGYFDDCQALVKRAFVDPELAKLNLTSANSISIGRLIPQIIYYVYTWAILCRDDIQVIVPSGNWGNLTGGLFAHAMGIPFHSFLAATNRNDAPVRYLETGFYNPQETVATLSNAMDVGNPSNFARVLELYGYNLEKMRDMIEAVTIDDMTTVQTMQYVYKRFHYLLDPHTAIGWHAANKYGDPDLMKVLIATASPVKFAAEIAKASGIRVDNSAEIAKLQSRPKRKTSIPNDYKALTDFLLNA